MRAVDTNVLVRLLTRDEPDQAAAADAFIQGAAWVSVVAFAEAIWVFESVYERSPGDIARGVEMLLNHEHLTLQDSDVIALALDLFRARPSLDFSDCLILELARKAGHLPLGTFDRRLAKITGAERL